MRSNCQEVGTVVDAVIKRDQSETFGEIGVQGSVFAYSRLVLGLVCDFMQSLREQFFVVEREGDNALANLFIITN